MSIFATSADQYYRQSVQALAEDRIEQALLYLDTAILTDPDHLQSYFLKSNTLYGMKKHSQTIQTLKLLLERSPSNGQAYYGMGLALSGLGHYEQALASFREAAKLGSSKTQLQQAKVLIKMGRIVQARSILSRLLSEDPSDSQVYKYLSESSLEENQLGQALQTIEKAISVHQKDTSSVHRSTLAELLCLKATILGRMERYMQACACYDLAQDQKQSNQVAAFGKICALLFANQLQQAQKLLKQVKWANENQGKAMCTQALYFAKNKKWTKSNECAGKANSHLEAGDKQQKELALVLKAISRRRQKDLTGALECVNQAINISSKSVFNHFYKAILLSQSKLSKKCNQELQCVKSLLLTGEAKENEEPKVENLKKLSQRYMQSLFQIELAAAKQFGLKKNLSMVRKVNLLTENLLLRLFRLQRPAFDEQTLAEYQQQIHLCLQDSTQERERALTMETDFSDFSQSPSSRPRYRSNLAGIQLTLKNQIGNYYPQSIITSKLQSLRNCAVRQYVGLMHGFLNTYLQTWNLMNSRFPRQQYVLQQVVNQLQRASSYRLPEDSRLTFSVETVFSEAILQKTHSQVYQRFANLIFPSGPQDPETLSFDILDGLLRLVKDNQKKVQQITNPSAYLCKKYKKSKKIEQLSTTNLQISEMLSTINEHICLRCQTSQISGQISIEMMVADDLVTFISRLIDDKSSPRSLKDLVLGLQYTETSLFSMALGQYIASSFNTLCLTRDGEKQSAAWLLTKTNLGGGYYITSKETGRQLTVTHDQEVQATETIRQGNSRLRQSWEVSYKGQGFCVIRSNFMPSLYLSIKNQSNQGFFASLCHSPTPATVSLGRFSQQNCLWKIQCQL